MPFVCTLKPDITPPSGPTGFAAAAVDSGSISLTVSAPATDAVGVSGYSIGVSDGRTLTTTTFPFTVGGLLAGTAYTFTCNAYDIQNNIGPTFTASASTPSATPGAIASFTVTALSSSSVTLTWTASSGANGYTITKNGPNLFSGPSGLSYTDGTVGASTTYTYTVKGYNDYGSGPATSLTVTTPAAGVTALTHGSQYTVAGSGFGTRANNNSLGLTWVVAGNTYNHMHRAWWDCSTTVADGSTLSQFLAGWGGWQPSIAEGTQWGFSLTDKQYPANGYQGNLGQQCAITGYVSGTTLTVVSVISGEVAAPGTLRNDGVTFGVATTFVSVSGGNSTPLGIRTVAFLSGTPNGVGTYQLNNSLTLGSAGSPVTLYGYRACGLEVLSGGSSQSGKYVHRYGVGHASDGAVSVYTRTDAAAASSLAGYMSVKVQKRGSGKGMRYWINSGAPGAAYTGDQWYLDHCGTGAGAYNDRVGGALTSYPQNNPVSGAGGVLTPWYREEIVLTSPGGPLVRRNQRLIQYKQNSILQTLGYAAVSYAGDTMKSSWFMYGDALDNGGADAGNNPLGPGEIGTTDLYFDYTAARVEIAQTAVQAGGSFPVAEPQILLSWADTTISYAFNKGSLASGSATLNVIDATDTVLFSTVVTVV
jgi:hypothetical protein